MRFWRLVNILSLDIAVGSVLGCAFFGRVFGVSLLTHAYLSLGLIVWIVYTVDHLLDAARSDREPSTERHRFHRHYRKPLMAALLVAGIIVTMEAFYVRKPVLFAGLGIALLVVGYLTLQASLKFAKEAAGAMLYTAGILAGPWSLMTRSLTHAEVGVVVLYGATALMNLMLFSLIDRDSDLKDDHVSFATIFGELVTRRVLSTGFVFVGAMAATHIIMFPGYAIPVATLVAMNLLLYYTFHYRKSLSVDDQYRRIGDLAFLVPGLYLLFQHALK